MASFRTKKPMTKEDRKVIGDTLTKGMPNAEYWKKRFMDELEK